MVYDQAQSPRLGQRVPIESTYVQMVDDENLLEAAYPGMLIFQNSTQQLLIWSEDDQAWASVATAFMAVALYLEVAHFPIFQDHHLLIKASFLYLLITAWDDLVFSHSLH